MSDEWRVEVDVEEHGGLRHLLDSAREHKMAREARERLAGNVTVTVDDDRLFAYAQTEDQAHEAHRILCELATRRGLQTRTALARWHPEEQRWAPIDEPLPRTPAERATERRARDAQQAGEARDRGYAEWEVRVELPDREAASDLTARLESEGIAVVCRSRVVVMVAASEDEATALAERIRGDVPEALRVTAEGSAAVAMDELNPFTVLSGRWRRT
jgi:hypothetical protein